MLDELDLALVDALQVNPRASWAALGDVLELAPVTLARRWQRLAESGAAWISVSLSNWGSRGAVVEFLCRPGSELSVARELSEVPNISTVCVTTGEYQVLALMLAPTLAGISVALLEALPVPDAVVRLRTHVYGSTFGGIFWRLGVLNRMQMDQVRDELGKPPSPIARAETTPQSRSLDSGDHALFLALGHDGRRAYTDLADDLGSTPQAVKRRLDRLRRHGDIVFRCDVARSLVGWHSMALFWIRVPDADMQVVGRSIGTWSETRHCAAVASPANLCVIVNLRSLEHLDELLLRLARDHPSVEVVDRRLVLRQVKVYGRIVDEQGRCFRVIPVDPWFRTEDHLI